MVQHQNHHHQKRKTKNQLQAKKQKMVKKRRVKRRRVKRRKKIRRKLQKWYVNEHQHTHAAETDINIRTYRCVCMIRRLVSLHDRMSHVQDRRYALTHVLHIIWYRNQIKNLVIKNQHLKYQLKKFLKNQNLKNQHL